MSYFDLCVTQTGQLFEKVHGRKVNKAIRVASYPPLNMMETLH